MPVEVSMETVLNKVLDPQLICVLLHRIFTGEERKNEVSKFCSQVAILAGCGATLARIGDPERCYLDSGDGKQK